MKNERYSKIKKVLYITLFFNLLVAVLKLLVGYISCSTSMIADGFHSFSDSVSNIVGLIGIYYAFKPADFTHNYGHQKFENISTMIISFILFLISFEIIQNSVVRFQDPQMPNITSANFVVMIIAMIINISVSKYESIVGNKLKSNILLSDAAHTKSDFFVSLSVLLTFFLVRSGYYKADLILSLIIGLIIAKIGFEILVPNLKILTDASPINPTDLETFIFDNFPYIEFVHKVRARGNRNFIYIDMHLGFKPDVTVKEAHDICHKIEEILKENYPEVRDIVTHIEPRE